MKETFRTILDRPSEKSATEFIKAELTWINNRPLRRYGPEILKAILEGNYSINRPINIKNLNMGDDPEIGFIYLAVAPERHPGKIKVGYTTTDPSSRLRKFATRYGYHIELLHFEDIKFPARAENKIHALLREFQVHRNASKESIEWFSTDAEKCKKILTNLKEQQPFKQEQYSKRHLLKIVKEEILRIKKGETDDEKFDITRLETALEEALDSITSEEAFVLRRYLGLIEGDYQSIYRIACTSGLRLDLVKKRFESSLRKLRHKSRSESLLKLFDPA
jgi:hypothetical protein